jgi:hypothetical protein
MIDDATLGGYVKVHSRPPAFTGPDGEAYSAAVYVDETAGDDGRFGGAVLFVRWSPEGDRPIGHLESPYLVYAQTVREAERLVEDLTLYEVKAALDRAVAQAEEDPD